VTRRFWAINAKSDSYSAIADSAALASDTIDFVRSRWNFAAALFAAAPLSDFTDLNQ
jgi:hypothetical protein